MSSRLVVAAGLVGALALIAGCSAKADDDAETVSSYESEMKLSGIRYLGRIANGQTRTGSYYNPPMYRSYAFDAKGGDEITVDVRSDWGDAMAWITDAKLKVLAFNDDDPATYTLDAKVTYKVPATEPAHAYRIVFRDYDKLDATFTVSLAIKSAAPAVCAYGEQQYDAGDSFEASDGCNTCSCGDDGQVACTKKACTCDPATETNRTYLGTPQQCAVIRYSCPAGQVQFSNTCGCGCETLPTPGAGARPG